MSGWHIVTGEFPPAPGGVSDYTQAVAAGLVAAGEVVHVWCPAVPGGSMPTTGVEVHAIAGAWLAPDLRRLDAAMNAIPGRKRLLVQWVPHAFGRRSLNLAFCRWINRRARSGDTLDLMVHEPGLAFREGTIRQDAAAAVHRLMAAVLLRRARCVWVAIPAWAETLRPCGLGRRIRFCWLPVPSTIPIAEPNGAGSRRRAEPPDAVVVGHFSTYSAPVRRDLRMLVPGLLASMPALRIELIGRGSASALEELRPAVGAATGERIGATGDLDPAALSRRMQTCDVMLQPYPDGASTRRTTLMAALAHGLPVVTTLGRLSEPFWRDSDAVAAVPAGDLPGLARTVTELARDPERRKRLSSSARATYEQRFSLSRVIETLRADACGAVG